MKIQTFLVMQEMSQIELGVKMGYPRQSAGQSVSQALSSGSSLAFMHRFNNSFPSFTMSISDGNYWIEGVGVRPVVVSMNVNELYRLTLLNVGVSSYIRSLPEGIYNLSYGTKSKVAITIHDTNDQFKASFPASELPFLDARLKES